MSKLMRPSMYVHLQMVAAKSTVCKYEGGKVEGCNIMKRTTVRPKVPESCRKRGNKDCRPNLEKKEKKPGQFHCSDKKVQNRTECSKGKKDDCVE